MALSPGQQADAQQIYTTAVQHGLPPARAKELALAAFHEGGLNPDAVNAQSGAAGDFQLLSPGYVQKAQALGGVHNTKANELAILPDYEKYWASHPGAPVGAAAAAVERSGKGADYYGADGNLLGFLGSVGGDISAGPAPHPAAPMQPLGPSMDARKQFALTIAQNIGSHNHDPAVFATALAQLHAAEQQEAPPLTVKPLPAMPGEEPHARFGVPVADLSSVSGLHPTEGLDGFPAHDYFAPAGSEVVAPISGRVVRLSGHSPGLGPIEGPHGPLGWSVYIKGSDGRVYYLTHMGSRDVKVGETLRTGQPIGTVANYAEYGTPSHIHMGVSGVGV